LRFSCEKEKDLGLRFHREMLRKLNAFRQGHFFQFEARAGFHLREKTSN
jgi:hypothetical protein